MSPTMPTSDAQAIQPARQTTLTELLERNKQYAADVHKPMPPMTELLVLAPPANAIITCADPRCNPDSFLRGQLGDFLALRNLGGCAATSIPEIATLDSEFKFKTLSVIHHTDCGALHMSAEGVRAWLKTAQPQLTTADIDAFPTLTFTNVEQSVKNDMKLIQESPYLRKELKEAACGFVFNVKTGLLTVVAK